MQLSPSMPGLPTVEAADERDWTSWWARAAHTPAPEPTPGTAGLWGAWLAPIEDVIWDTCAATARGENPQRDLDWAQTFGCPTVPLVPGTKRPKVAWSSVGAQDSAGPDDGSGRAALTGHTIDVLDIDGLVGLSSFNRLVRPILEACRIPALSIQRSRRGWHIIVPAMGGKNAAGVFPGVDVRAVGGIIVAAPTAHASGRYYLHYAPAPAAMAEAQAWSAWWQAEHSGLGLGELLSAYAKPSAPAPAAKPASTAAAKRTPASAPAAKPASRGTYRRTGATSTRMAMWQEKAAVTEIEKVASAPDGQRNHTLNLACYTLARAFCVTPEPGIDAGAVWEDMRRAALATGLPGDEVDDVMERASQDGVDHGPGNVAADLLEHEARFQDRRAAA